MTAAQRLARPMHQVGPSTASARPRHSSLFSSLTHYTTRSFSSIFCIASSLSLPTTAPSPMRVPKAMRDALKAERRGALIRLELPHPFERAIGAGIDVGEQLNDFLTHLFDGFCVHAGNLARRFSALLFPPCRAIGAASTFANKNTQLTRHSSNSAHWTRRFACASRVPLR